MHACLVMFNTLWSFGLQPARLLCTWHFPGKNTGGGCHFFLQGIFLTRELNPIFPVSPALQADSLPAEPLGESFSFHRIMNIFLKYFSGTLRLHSIILGLELPTFSHSDLTFLKKLFLNGRIYNVVLVSYVQQSDSVIHIHTHTHIHVFFFRFFSLIGYYKTLNIVPCVIRQVPVAYLFYIQ